MANKPTGPSDRPKSSLPDPLVPAYCDLRDTPFPLSLFVQMAVAQFGCTPQEAEKLIRDVAEARGWTVNEDGHHA